MNDTLRSLSRWLLLIIVFATGGCLLFQGCSKQTPTEAPSTTVITGNGSITIDAVSGTDSYSFLSSGHNYGKITLSASGSNGVFQAPGIMVGSGTTAPDSGYGTYSSVAMGQSYFIKTDLAPHYGRIQVSAISHNSSAQTLTVQFTWVVQTEAGNCSLQ
jgi:hypothetical protein